jgi:hypothetical protein
MQETNSVAPCDVCATGTRNLQDDLNDFLAIVPRDQIIAIALEYLSNDKEVQDFIVYLQSEKFHTIVRAVENLDEYKQVSINHCMYMCVNFQNLKLIYKTLCSVLTCGNVVLF